MTELQKEELETIAFVSSVVSRSVFVTIYRQPQYVSVNKVHEIVAETTMWIIENKAMACATKSIAEIVLAAKMRLLETNTIKEI